LASSDKSSFRFATVQAKLRAPTGRLVLAHVTLETPVLTPSSDGAHGEVVKGHTYCWLCSWWASGLWQGGLMRSDHIAASPICDSSPSTADTGTVVNHGTAGRVQAVNAHYSGRKPCVRAWGL